MNHLALNIFLFLQESMSGIVSSPDATVVQPTIVNLVSWLKLFIELTGATIIAIGVILAIAQFFRTLSAGNSDGYTQIRLLLARYLALALEFQLGADILSTAISPSWDQIGKLGAIAVIRTALNYFLSREMEQEREITRNEKAVETNSEISA